MKSINEFINEYYEWDLHKGAEFLELEISTCKVYLLTKEQVLKNWDLTEKDLDEMESSSKHKDDNKPLNVICDGKWILIKH